MSNQWKYLLGLLLLFLLACNRAGEHEALFRQVESVMNKRPDSAMVLLESIQNPERLPERDWAYWALLTTQAKDKLYIRHTSDSVINRVVDYFDGFSFFRYRHEKALAYYYKGRVNNDLGHLEEALKAYHKAYDNAKWTDDYKLTYLIESNVGKIYLRQDMYHLALSAYKNADKAVRQANDSTSMAYTSAYLGRVYGKQENWKQANAHYKQSIKISEQIGNNKILHLGIQELMAIYTDQDSLDAALDLVSYLDEIEMRMGRSRNQSTNLTIGEIYRKKQETDSAYFYLSQAISSNNIYTRLGAYQSLYYLYMNNQPHRAIQYNTLYEACRDSIEAMGTSSDSFQIHEARNAEKRKWERILGFVLIATTSLGLVYLFYCYSKNKRKSKNKFEEYKQTSQSEKQRMFKYFNEVSAQMNDQLLKFESRCERIGKEKENIERQKEESDKRILDLEGRLKSYEEKRSQIERGEIIVLELRKELKALPNKEDRTSVLAFVDATSHDFVTRLKYNFPELKRADIEYSAFVRLNFDLRALSIILGIDVRSVSRRKQHVKTCIKPELLNGMDVDVFLRIF